MSDLELTLDCDNSGIPGIIAQTIQAQLSQIGIAVQVNAQDTASYDSIGQESAGDRWKDVQLFIRNDSSLPDPSYYTLTFVKAQVGIWNWERFRSDRYDELNDKAMAIDEPNERAKLYYEMQDLLEDSGAYRFLTNGATPVVYRTTRIQA
ncbi:MAG: peptide ABC transporter substrate-binding protein, partial [Mesorhizobium sp.]